MRKTCYLHLEAIRKPPKYRPDSGKSVYETAQAGNALIIEEQFTKVAEIQSNHRPAYNLYAKRNSMLKIALSKQNA
jgi:flagellar basal body rod protein FlgB